MASKRAATRKIADTPTRFLVENMPDGDSILVPKVSSERRKYIPLGRVPAGSFCSDLVFLIPNASLFHFGVLHSQFHNAWMRQVAGRLEARYRYSGGVVYNNFVWPTPDQAQHDAVVSAAQAVLDARGLYPDSTIAQMYDPKYEFLYPELTVAHDRLNLAVENAYGFDFAGMEYAEKEAAIVSHLFELYAAASEQE
nr:type IIL restriction-modification enzyme MmeI [Corynebacterium renale]